MDATQIKRAKEVFQLVVDLPDEQRESLLTKHCAGDAHLRAFVQELLSHDAAGMGEFMCKPVVASSLGDSAGATESLPDRIGRYEVVRLIGEGGMGTVYEARQEQPQRTVALKVIRSGLPSTEMLRRFQHEAEILGQLQHPGIACIHEAGMAEISSQEKRVGRQPFFAMELVRGKPLSEYAAENEPTIRDRLELVAKICDAVQHAHLKSVIHRDLKPGNILVDETGQPKVLDFGVARATDADMRTVTMQTGARQLIGTLPYMSPEQVTGDSRLLDTRSDVYALGVILYELLSGELPHDVRNRSIAEAARIIRDEEPSRLSSIKTRVPGLGGEVETIVVKAMEKDKSRRYQSASDLARDIRRYLANEPILARPPSALYQLRKFAKRNKALVGAVSIAIAALTWAVIDVTLERNRALRAERVAEQQRAEAQMHQAEAEQEAANAEAVLRFLNLDLLAGANPRNTPNRDITVRELLDAASEKVEGRFKDRPLIEATIHQTLGDAYFALGRWDSAEFHLEAARRLRVDHLGEESPAALSAMSRVAALYEQQGRFDEAQALVIKILQQRRRALGEEHLDTLRCMADLAVLHKRQGRYDAAETLLVEAGDIYGRLRDQNAVTTVHISGNLADVYVKQGRYGSAEPLFLENLEIGRSALGPEHPSVLSTMNNLAGLYIRQDRYGEAEPLYLETLEARRRVLGDEHPKTLTTMNSLAILYKRQRRFDEAEPLCLETLQVKRRVLGEEHPQTLNSANNLASLYGVQGRWDDAEPLFVTTLDMRRRVLGEEHPKTLRSAANLAHLYALQGRNAEAEPLYLQTLETARRVLGDDHRQTLSVWHGLTKVLVALDRFEDAEPLANECYERTEATLGPLHHRTHDAIRLLINLYEAWGKPEQATHWKAKMAPTPAIANEEEHATVNE